MKYLNYVIGHVPEKDNIKEIIKNGKRTKVMDIMLQDLEYNSLHCTLWEEYTEEMQKHLDQHDCPNPVVVVIQLCKLKKYLDLFPFLLKQIGFGYEDVDAVHGKDVDEALDHICAIRDVRLELRQWILSCDIRFTTGFKMLCRDDEVMKAESEQQNHNAGVGIGEGMDLCKALLI
ncbi:hypothetical protein JHK84_040175 [Glycine max]|nr:hypothetical protein JHK84_040175 [Glycine max]